MDLYQYVPDGGTVVPPGGPTPLTASIIDAGGVNSFTFGYDNTFGDDGWGADIPHNWYKFVPSQSGDMIFDAGLSYDTAIGGQTSSDPGVFLNVYTGSGSTVGELTSFASSTSYFGTSRGRIQQAVTAGTTYWIRIGTWDTSGTVVMFLLMGNYPVITDWIQGDDQPWVFWVTDGQFGPNSAMNHAKVLPPSHPSNFDPGGIAAYRTNAYSGSYQFDQSFGGPPPWQDSATYLPAWKNGHAGQAGGQWWSPDPTNPDVDIKASWNGGPGTAILHESENLPGTGAMKDTFVGIVWDVDVGTLGGHDSDSYATYAVAWRFQASLISQLLLTASAGANTPTDFPTTPGGFSGNLEWETTTSTFVKLEAAPDDSTNSTNTNGVCMVYAKVVPEQDYDGWGPASYTQGFTTHDSGAWQGGLDGPGSFPPKQTIVINDSWDGSNSTFVDITSLYAPALTQEAIDATTLLPGESTVGQFSRRGAIRFVSIPFDLPSEGLPPHCMPIAGSDNVSGRNMQLIVIRITLRPARHRWVGFADLPVTNTEPVNTVIAGDVTDTRRRFT